MAPDPDASLNPAQLEEYVKTIRLVESYMGTNIKAPTDDEIFTRKSLQKCLVAAVLIKKGETIKEEMIVAKRTGGKGISPLFYNDLIGKKAVRNFNKNEIIER